MSGKRENYITWDEYFMAVAKLAGLRSKDPNSQVGSCIVSTDNKILSMGYNGFPLGCSDDEYPWAREGEPLDTKYVYVTHSELNAILNYRGEIWKGQKSMYPYSRAMSVPRPLFRAALRKSFMMKINMRIRLRSSLQSGCWIPPESATENTK